MVLLRKNMQRSGEYIPEKVTLEEIPILGDVALPLLRHRIVSENRFDWALRLASAAVDTLVGVDIVLVLALVNTIHRANRYA